MSESNKTQNATNNGLEGKLAAGAWVLLVLCLFVASLLLIGGNLIPAAAFAAVAWFVWLVLQGLAEAVRLLKKANDLPYSGTISKSSMPDIIRCSDCGEVLIGTTFCDTCQRDTAEQAH